MQTETPSTRPSLKMQKSAKIIVTKNKVREKVLEQIKEAYDPKLKLHAGFVQSVMQAVEDEIHNNKRKKINKKTFVIDLLTEVCGLQADERETLDKMIDYIIESGAIKKKRIPAIVGRVVRGLSVFLSLA